MTNGHCNVAAELTAVFTIAVIGTALRLTHLGLPLFFVKYGGSVLWGAMVLLIVGAFSQQSQRWWITPLTAASIAFLSEIFRLYHTPALDSFRLTLPGQLLLGRVFNVRNIVAYWVGIIAAWPAHRAIVSLIKADKNPSP